MSEDKKMPETLILQGILALIFYPTVEDGSISQGSVKMLNNS